MGNFAPALNVPIQGGVTLSAVHLKESEKKKTFKIKYNGWKNREANLKCLFLGVFCLTKLSIFYFKRCQSALKKRLTWGVCLADRPFIGGVDCNMWLEPPLSGSCFFKRNVAHCGVCESYKKTFDKVPWF